MKKNFWCNQLCSNDAENSLWQQTQKINFEKKNKMFLKLHKEYTQSNLKNCKFDKQRVDSISVLIKVKKLTYKLNISNIWKIHSVVSITHLKFASEENDFYEKKSTESKSVEIEKNDEIDIYKMKKIVAKRIVRIERKKRRKTHSKFKIKWIEWSDHHNKWMKRNELINCKKLLIEFEIVQEAQF